MNIAEVRAKYPEYSDLSDGQLADSLHAKFYSDIPKEQFYSKVGLKAETSQTKPSFSGFLSDVVTGKNDARGDIARNAVEQLPLVGSIVGGIAGAPGGPITSAGGTALGTTIGTSAKQLIQNLAEDKKLSPTETLKEQGANVATQTVLDIAGSGVVAGLNKTAQALSPVIREGVTKAQDMLIKKGGSLSGAQVAESAPIELMEAFARSGAGGKHAFITLDKNNAKVLNAITDDIISSASKNPVSDARAGKLFQSAISRGGEAHQYASSQLYASFDNSILGKNISVDMMPVKTFATDMLDKFKVINDVGKTDAGGVLINRLAGQNDKLSFVNAHNLRSELLQIVRDLKATNSEGTAIRNASIAAQKLEASMEAGAKTAGQDIYKQYRGISEFYKKGKAAFDNDVIVNLMNKNPERVGETLFQSGNVSDIIQAKASLRQADQFAKSNPNIGNINTKNVL